jgi:hypothetical protein
MQAVLLILQREKRKPDDRDAKAKGEKKDTQSNRRTPACP